MDEGKEETPPVSPPATIYPGIAGKPEPENPPCQWFLSDNEFCDKIKKVVKCGGDVKKCPF